MGLSPMSLMQAGAPYYQSAVQANGRAADGLNDMMRQMAEDRRIKEARDAQSGGLGALFGLGGAAAGAGLGLLLAPATGGASLAAAPAAAATTAAPAATTLGSTAASSMMGSGMGAATASPITLGASGATSALGGSGVGGAAGALSPGVQASYDGGQAAFSAPTQQAMGQFGSLQSPVASQNSNINKLIYAMMGMGMGGTLGSMAGNAFDR